MSITAQQERFIQEYLKLRKGAEAARRAGYSEHTARFQASRLLTDANILNEINSRTKANGMGLDEAVSRLSDFARADLGDWINDDGEIDIAAMKRDGATHMIRKVKRTRRTGVSASGTEWEEVTAEVELHDAKDANKFIADLHSRGPKGTEGDPFHFKFIEGVSENDR